jgi:glucan phosphorylase
MRVLFVQGTPVPLRGFLIGHEVVTAFEVGWSAISNGDLLEGMMVQLRGQNSSITTTVYTDEQGRFRVRWIPAKVVRGVARDTPILGYRVGTCNPLRLWKAEAVESFDFAAFNHGEYYRAVEDKMASENITKVLYPNDEVIQGKTLRLQQQFFFVSCSLQDIVARFRLASGTGWSQLPDRAAIQLNDTHPSLSVAELMRILLDQAHLGWDDALLPARAGVFQHRPGRIDRPDEARADQRRAVCRHSPRLSRLPGDHAARAMGRSAEGCPGRDRAD